MNTNPQRVDVARLEIGLREDGSPKVFVKHNGPYVRYSDYAALLQQLAEREAAVATLREAFDLKDAAFKLMRDAALEHKSRAEAAEHAREEACGLLRDVIAWRRTVSIDETPNRKDGGISGRIAAFLAANAPTHSAGGE